MTTARSSEVPVHSPAPRSSRPRRRSGWTVGSIIALALGILLLLASAGMLIGGVAVSAVDAVSGEDGYVTSDPIPLSTPGHAVATGRLDLEDFGPGSQPDRLLGEVRLRATSAEADTAVFIGVAPTDQATTYLDGVEHATISEFDDPATEYSEHSGGAPSEPPADSDIWVAHAAGAGTQSLTWGPAEGAWTIVVMNADGSAGIDVSTDVGATFPLKDNVARLLLIGSIPFGLLGLLLVTAAVWRRRTVVAR
jgi:hypothetical protein